MPPKRHDPTTRDRRVVERVAARRAVGRIRLGLAVLLAVVAASTVWLWLAEDFGFVEALYQSVMTVTTVGFREVHRLDTSGQIVAMLVAVIGVGAALYTLTGLFEEIVERQADRFGRRRMDRSLAEVDEHVVICGYGRIGAKTAQLLRAGGDTVVVVEHDEARAIVAAEEGLLVVRGDATTDAALAEAALGRARILVSALPTDADNIYVVLTGRTVNPSLHIVARGQSAESEAKLLRAGADRVVNPENIGAHRIATVAVRPNVSEFLDVVLHGTEVEFRVEELDVAPGSSLDGHSIRAASIRERTGALVLGMRTDDEVVVNPADDAPVHAGMTLIAIGTDEQLAALAEVVGSPGVRS